MSSTGFSLINIPQGGSLVPDLVWTASDSHFLKILKEAWEKKAGKMKPVSAAPRNSTHAIWKGTNLSL